MNKKPKNAFKLILIYPLILCSFLFIQPKAHALEDQGLPLYYWREPNWSNFGDILSLKIVEKILGGPVRAVRGWPVTHEKKMLAIGSILYFATEGDVVWGSGINGKCIQKENYTFSTLDIRALRGPITRQFLSDNFGIAAPEIYGDPALLTPYLFPEFQRKENPSYDYIIIPHYKDEIHFPQTSAGNVVSSKADWKEIIEKIVNSRFVISTSLHGIIVAEAFGIPARLLRVTENEWIFKYHDYYEGTGRPRFKIARSVQEALDMGGEEPPVFDPVKLFNAFPFDCYPNRTFFKPDFSKLAK